MYPTITFTMATSNLAQSMLLVDAITNWQESVDNAVCVLHIPVRMCGPYTITISRLTFRPKPVLEDSKVRAEITKANAETCDALRERDELRLLLQLAESSKKEEIGALRAAVCHAPIHMCA